MAVVERLGLTFTDGIVSTAVIGTPLAALPFEQAEAEAAVEAARLARVAVGLAALEQLPVLEEQGVRYARCADVFGKACDPRFARLPLNRKTTENEVLEVALDRVEPSQELVAIGGLRKYIEHPRRDYPDICCVMMLDGTERWIVQDGHTRAGAAILRGELTYPMRVWRFTEAADGTFQPVVRGLQKRGEMKRLGLSFTEDGVLDLGNPYHDQRGRFTSKDTAQVGAAELVGKSGKPLPEWRVRRRLEKEAARKAALQGGGGGGSAPPTRLSRKRERIAQQAREQDPWQLERLPGVNEKALRAAEEATGRECVTLGGTRMEYARVLAGDGTVVAKASGSAHRVSIGGPVVEKMRDPRANLTWVHNHPNETSLSPTDYRTSAMAGIRTMVAYGADGSVYRGKAFDRDIGPLWKGKYDAVWKASRDPAAPYVPQSVVNQFAAHLVNLSLARSGRVSYEFTLSARTQELWNRHSKDLEGLLGAASAAGKRVRQRRPRFRFAFADYDQDAEIVLIDPPGLGDPPEEWWAFIDEMDEEEVPEELWIDDVPDDLPPRAGPITFRTVFHGTPAENLESIKADGLCPTPANPLHFAPDEDTAAAWGGLRAKERGDGSYLVLRIRTDAELRDNGQGELIASETIPATDIEVKVGDEWRPIHMDDGGGGDAGGDAGNPAPSLPYSYPSVLKSISVQLQPTARKRKFARKPKRFEMSLLSLNEVPDRLDAAEATLAANLADAIAELDPITGALPEGNRQSAENTLSSMAQYGGQQVRIEFSRQGADGVPEADIDVEHAAEELGVALNTGLAEAYRSALAKVTRREMPEASLPMLLSALVAREAERLVKRLAAHAVNAAYTFGRQVQQQAVVSLAKEEYPIDLSEIDVVQTNVMDKNTCAMCEAVNGEVMTYGSSRMYELEPPYILCLGEDRCRCHQLALVPGHGAIDRADISDEELEDLLHE